MFYVSILLQFVLGLLDLIDILQEVILKQLNAQYQSLSARIGARFPSIPPNARGGRTGAPSIKGTFGLGKRASTDMICAQLLINSLNAFYIGLAIAQIFGENSVRLRKSHLS